MKEDPIVKEIHQVREKLLAECGGDLEKLMDRFKTHESDDRKRIISLGQLKKQAKGNEGRLLVEER